MQMYFTSLQTNKNVKNSNKKRRVYLCSGYFSVVFSHQIMSNSFVTPWTVACLAPLSIGCPRQEYWSGQSLPPPGDLPTQVSGVCESSFIGTGLLIPWNICSLSVHLILPGLFNSQTVNSWKTDFLLQFFSLLSFVLPLISQFPIK